MLVVEVTFNQEKAVVGIFSVIMKTDGSFAAIIYYSSHIPQANTVYWLGCDYLSDAIYWVDILFVKPRIMFLDASGIYETGRKECAKNYVRHGDFKVDIISVIPFELVYIFLGVRGWTTIFRANRRSYFCCK